MHFVSHITETDGARTCNSYKLLNGQISSNENRKENQNWESFTSFFMTVFLPHGYPTSVSKDYLQYQIWDSIQAFASSITGSICTHAVLKGAGVGDENASPLAATVTWLIKDGTSMVGRITFAWLEGTKLDSDCKKWRLFADVMNDLAMLLDLLSAYFQSHFTAIICFSGLLKSLVGVAGGSTRAALTQHQARKNNMADVSAKDGSQETLVNLLALICSLILMPIVTKSLVLTWLLYFSMTVIHLTANYFAVKSVVMETFNSARFKIFAQQYLSHGSSLENLLAVDKVNRRESVFFSLKSDRTVIKLGSSFKDIIKGKSYKEVEDILNLYKECDYMLSCTIGKNGFKTINVGLSRKATALTEIEAMYHTCVFEKYGKIYLNEDELFSELTTSRYHAKKTFPDFLKCIKNMGFNVNAVYFNTDKWRLDW